MTQARLDEIKALIGDCPFTPTPCSRIKPQEVIPELLTEIERLHSQIDAIYAGLVEAIGVKGAEA